MKRVKAVVEKDRRAADRERGLMAEMAKIQTILGWTGELEQARILLNTAKRDLDRRDRVDASDSIAIAQSLLNKVQTAISETMPIAAHKPAGKTETPLAIFDRAAENELKSWTTERDTKLAGRAFKYLRERLVSLGMR